MSTILGYVTSFATSVFSIGSQLVTWITAEGHEIALIGLVMFILVAAVGMIRRLIKGV